VVADVPLDARLPGSQAAASLDRGYGLLDEARYLDEQPKSSARSPYARDRARILHSAGLRRLADKTQVVGPRSSDFARNRLTHSLEVAQIGRDLATVLRLDADIVEAACLAHDMGHPPFGHNGEQVLDEAAATCGGFEGNAQTFRLLTRLEPKTLRDDGSGGGLNLTRAVLDAASKYPWGKGAGRTESDRKFGVYDDDRPVFDWMRTGAPLDHPSIEAQVMDFADDLAYCVHDVEDGIVAGRIDPATLEATGLRTDVKVTIRRWYDDRVDDTVLDEAWDRLSGEPAWPTGAYSGTRRQLASLKNLTSSLIGRLCRSVEEATLRSADGRPVRRHDGDLLVPADAAAEILVLKGIAAHFVMSAADRVAEMDAERTLLAELVDVLSMGGADALDPMFAADYAAASTDGERARVVVDQVASLTDVSATMWHARWSSGSGGR
jgi:dGTPase